MSPFSSRYVSKLSLTTPMTFDNELAHPACLKILKRISNMTQT